MCARFREAPDYQNKAVYILLQLCKTRWDITNVKRTVCVCLCVLKKSNQAKNTKLVSSIYCCNCNIVVSPLS
ncbi:hypothetical protein GQ44DRAFT_696678 [Phaeosphaeriaceae sp. PMI808]|nr:hypothetical protein GQ44DRAFT_696678 [Phaeosphaeriaceae sp. PMI808]